MTSLVSIFTSKELMNMSSSYDTNGELINNSNNIIKTLKSHENAINRKNAAIKQVIKQIDNWKNNCIRKESNRCLYRIICYQTIWINYYSTPNKNVGWALSLSLLKNRLSLKLVPLNKLQPVLSKIRFTARIRGYELAINSASDVYIC